MIWVDSHDAGSIGEMVDLVELEGASWEVWQGENAEFGFSTVTYRRTEGTSNVTFDLIDFGTGALDRVDATSDWYLLGVEAGFELRLSAGVPGSASGPAGRGAHGLRPR